MKGATTQAIVLAAGEAQRLRPLTTRRAKGMLLVGNQPLLQHLLGALKAAGVRDVALVVGHAREGVQAFFKDGKDFGLRITYAHQSERTGTADAARIALPAIDRKRSAWIVPGDNYLTPETLRPLAEVAGDALLLAPPQSGPRYGIPSLKGDRLVALRDREGETNAALVSTGVIHATPKMLAALGGSKHRYERDFDGFLHAYVKEGARVRTARAAGPWIDVTSPWDVLRLNEKILGDNKKTRYKKNRAAVAGTATIIEPVLLGEGCTIGDYSVVGPYVSVRNNTTIGSHCEVRRSILNNNVFLDSRSLVRNSILDDGARIGSGFACLEARARDGALGCVIGADAELGPDCRVEGGAFVAAETRAPAGTRLKAGG